MKNLKTTILKTFLAIVLILAGFLALFQKDKAWSIRDPGEEHPRLEISTLLNPSLLDSRAKDKTNWFQNIIPETQAAAPFASPDPRRLTIYGGVITVVNGTASATNAMEIGQAHDNGLGFASTDRILLFPDSVSSNPAYFTGGNDGQDYVDLTLTNELVVDETRMGNSIMRLGNAGRDIQSSGEIFLRPNDTNANSKFWGSAGTSQSLYLSGKLGVGNSAPSATIVANNNIIDAGSSGDAIVAAASSINSAIFARQTGAGYAGYFSGKTAIVSNTADPTLYVNQSGSGFAIETNGRIWARSNVSAPGATIYGEQQGSGYAGYFSGRSYAYLPTGNDNIPVLRVRNNSFTGPVGIDVILERPTADPPYPADWTGSNNIYGIKIKTGDHDHSNAGDNIGLYIDVGNADGQEVGWDGTSYALYSSTAGVINDPSNPGYENVAYAGYFEGDVRVDGHQVHKRWSFNNNSGDDWTLAAGVPAEIYKYRRDIVANGLICVNGKTPDTEDIGQPTNDEWKKCCKVNWIEGCKQGDSSCIIACRDATHEDSSTHNNPCTCRLQLNMANTGWNEVIITYLGATGGCDGAASTADRTGEASIWY